MPQAASVTALKEAVYARDRFKGRISLDPITACMDAFNNPQQDSPVIQIAGTNGKGSTATILARLLQEAGYTTGLYTSPHLTTLRERVHINQEMVSWQDVRRVHEKVEQTDIDLSFFEFTTALAYDQFSQEDVDVAVVEAGMGGRLDATSVADPVVSVITNVARDHTTILGETPEQIAHEKAGIIVDGQPVVSGASGTPQQVIEQVATNLSAPLHPVDDRVAPAGRTADGLELVYRGEQVQTQLHGTYQVDNINTALSALAASPFTASDIDVRSGLEQVTVPGRMEVVDDTPLTVLDGAHNPAGMRRAVETFDRVAQGDMVAVISIMGEKDYEAMLSVLDDVADTIICSRARMDRAADPAALAGHVDAAVVEPDVASAIEQARARTNAQDTIVYTGSLYFVGNVKEALQD